MVRKPVPRAAIDLPKPTIESPATLEQALAGRRSRRRYARRGLTLAEIAQLLWAAQGITSADGDRTAPSAGALFPLEVLLVCGDLDELAAGVYRYEPDSHRLRAHADGDRRRALATAAVEQDWMRRAPVVLVVTGVVARTAARYGARAERYVLMEAGAAAENVHLQAESLGLATVIVGAFEDGEVATILGLEPGERPYALMPVGER